jgi:hypothetical protein
VSTEKTIQIVVTGCHGAWIARTPDGRTHIGETKTEAVNAATECEKARRERIAR